MKAAPKVEMLVDKQDFSMVSSTGSTKGSMGTVKVLKMV
jgi:hypothetical protein